MTTLEIVLSLGYLAIAILTIKRLARKKPDENMQPYGYETSENAYQ